MRATWKLLEKSGGAGVRMSDIAKGAEAGLSIVFLAIYLDRVTAALGAPREKGSLLSLIKKR